MEMEMNTPFVAPIDTTPAAEWRHNVETDLRENIDNYLKFSSTADLLRLISAQL